MKPSQPKTSFAYQLARSFLPSPISAVLCVCVGVGVVLAYFVVLSLNAGTALPLLFEGEWGVAYTNHVVRPLLAVFSNFTFSKVMYLALWGAAGLLLYFAVEYAALLYRNYRSAKQLVHVDMQGRVHRAASKAFFVTASWRALVLVVFGPLFVLALQSTIQQLAALGPMVVLGRAPVHDIVGQLALSVLVCALMAHAVVVCLRLFVMRMRLFGDDPL